MELVHAKTNSNISNGNIYIYMYACIVFYGTVTRTSTNNLDSATGAEVSLVEPEKGLDLQD